MEPSTRSGVLPITTAPPATASAVDLPAAEPAPTFESFGLAPRVLEGVRDLGYTSPTPIQLRAVPIAMTGRDLIGSASTGTGKTAAFLLPILHQLVGSEPGTLRVLVLSPTRELALQIDEQAMALGYHLGFSSVAVVGGLPMGDQEHALKAGVEIVVATPGRLLDHLRWPYLDLSTVKYLVLDEADRMLDMGFLPDIQRILAKVPAERQTLFFSATMPPEIRKLADQILVDPVTVAVDPQKPAKDLKQRAFSVAAGDKQRLLIDLLRVPAMRSVIVFVKRKKDANDLRDAIARSGRHAGSLHSDRSQEDRNRALDAFRRGACEVLVATDVAARGIDVDGVTHVVHFDVPRSAEDYIHRSGRTARGGASGEVLTFVSPAEEDDFRKIEAAIGAQVPRYALKRSAVPRGRR